jgi:DNA-binding transcriptional ArsR family regulator
MEATLTKRTTAAEALRHPIRVRILEALNTRDEMSPVEFVRSGLMRGLPGIKGKSLSGQMSHSSYHFRALAAAGLIELTRTQPVRGTEEHFYVARSRAYFTDAEWEEMEEAERADISKTMITGFLAQAEGAMLTGTLDARTDRWLAWIPFNVDERGWDDMTTAIRDCYVQIEQIREESGERLRAGEGPPVPATFGIFGFESPQMGDAPTLGADGATPVSTEGK